ncbi:uncharacterized protein LOC106012684 [Aplysia californica]|uniref:XK-related protein n=1 Tax=Aplysia californica TaxID=6500 RepID=A0ABM1A6L2_APLCA|nr:uncharacterized protein LOC106012684 [Aplysia californica]
MAVMLVAFSVMALYAETILQLYVVMSSHAQPLADNPVAITILLMTLSTFLVTSVTSAVLTLASMNFGRNKGAKIMFGALHAVNLGYLWRIFKLILCFSEFELKQLILIRLVHVAFQSSPYVVLYTELFVGAQKINVIQSLSLMTSVVSSALAITAYNLRRKLNTDSWTNKISDSTTNSRAYTAIVMTIVGTLLVISPRFMCISFMAVQTSWWVAVPICAHFIFMLTTSILFSKRRKPNKRTCDGMCSAFLFHTGMSILNCLDLVDDHIDRVMCRYVGFYSLFLIENIVLLSFWLLGSDLPYVSKLIIVIGILTCFIVGLIAKFVGCNLLQDTQPQAYGNDVTSLATVTTASTSNMAENLTFSSDTTVQSSVNDNDLISIIQATLHSRRLRQLGLPLDNSSTSPHEQIAAIKWTSPQYSERLGKEGDITIYTLPSCESNDGQNGLQSNCSHVHEVHELNERESCHTISSSRGIDLSQASTSVSFLTSSESARKQSETRTLVPAHHLSVAEHRTVVQPQHLYLGTSLADVDLKCDMLYGGNAPTSNPSWEVIPLPFTRFRGRTSNKEFVEQKSAMEKEGRFMCLTGKTSIQNSSHEYPPMRPFGNIKTGRVPGKISYRYEEEPLAAQSTPQNKSHLRTCPKSKKLNKEKEGITNVTNLRNRGNVFHGQTSGYKLSAIRQMDKAGRRNFVFEMSETEDSTSISESFDSRFVTETFPQNARRKENRGAEYPSRNLQRFPPQTRFYAENSESSFLSTSLTQDTTFTGSSVTSESSEQSWSDEIDCSATWPFSESRFERNSRLALPGEGSKLPSSENVLRWLAMAGE